MHPILLTLKSGLAMKILVVDDCEASRLLVTAILTKSGIPEVLEAENLDQGMEQLKVNKGKVELVIMDLSKPGVNGIDAVRLFKSESGLDHIPILAITTYDNETGIEEALEAGVDDFLTKPISRLELATRTRTLLRYHAEMVSRRLAEEQAMMLENELLSLCSTDDLTGLGSEEMFNSVLTNEWHRSLRSSASLGLFLVNIDQFEEVNTLLGNSAGDDMIKNVARTIRNSLKRSGDFIARLGGATFALVLPNMEPEGAKGAAQLIFDNMALANIPHPSTAVSSRITVTIGASVCFPLAGISEQSLFNETKKFFDEAVRAGGNRVEFRLLPA